VWPADEKCPQELQGKVYQGKAAGGRAAPPR
jgi:hypothetical protein